MEKSTRNILLFSGIAISIFGLGFIIYKKNKKKSNELPSGEVKHGKTITFSRS